MSKKLLLLLVLLFFLVGVRGVLLLFPNGIPKITRLDTLFSTTKPKNQVISWNGESGQFVFFDENSKTQTLQIAPTMPLIMVRTNLPNEPFKEELVPSPFSPFWRQAFCPGDTLAIDYAEDGHVNIP